MGYRFPPTPVRAILRLSSALFNLEQKAQQVLNSFPFFGCVFSFLREEFKHPWTRLIAPTLIFGGMGRPRYTRVVKELVS